MADGDTLTFLDNNKGLTKIRLHQIDAPEKKQDFGQRSKQSLSDLIYGKQVRVEMFETDKYLRKVGKVWVNDQDANLKQVKRGMAWVYVKYASEPAYFAAERSAKSGRICLWNQPNPTRHGCSDILSGLSRAQPLSPLPWLANHLDAAVKSACKEMVTCEEARFC